MIAHSLIRHFQSKKQEICQNDVYDWLDRIRVNSLNQRFDKSISFQDFKEKNALTEFKEQVRKEIEDEYQKLCFIERFKKSIKVLLGK